MLRFLIIFLSCLSIGHAQPNDLVFQITNAQFSGNNLRLTTLYRVSSIAYIGMETELLTSGSTSIQNTGVVFHMRTNSISNRGAGGTYLFGSGYWGRNLLGEIGRFGIGARFGLTQRVGFHISLERTWKDFKYTTSNYTDKVINVSYGLTFGF